MCARKLVFDGKRVLDESAVDEEKRRLDQAIDQLGDGVFKPASARYPFESDMVSPVDLNQRTLNVPLASQYVFPIDKVKLPKVRQASESVYFLNAPPLFGSPTHMGALFLVSSQGHAFMADHCVPNQGYQPPDPRNPGFIWDGKEKIPLTAGARINIVAQRSLKYHEEEAKKCPEPDVALLHIPQLEGRKPLKIAEDPIPLDGSHKAVTVGYPEITKIMESEEEHARWSNQPTKYAMFAQIYDWRTGSWYKQNPNSRTERDLYLIAGGGFFGSSGSPAINPHTGEVDGLFTGLAGSDLIEYRMDELGALPHWVATPFQRQAFLETNKTLLEVMRKAGVENR